LKWPKKVFWWLIELAAHNAHIVYSSNRARAGLKKVSLLKFQLELIESLCGGAGPGQGEGGEDGSDGEDVNDEEDEDGGHAAVRRRLQPQAKRVRAPRNDPGRRLEGSFREVKRYCGDTVSQSTLPVDYVLYCSVLYYSVLYYSVLYCSVLYCSVLYYSVLYYSVLYCSVLYY
jgi:hypothetical protein